MVVDGVDAYIVFGTLLLLGIPIQLIGCLLHLGPIAGMFVHLPIGSSVQLFVPANVCLYLRVCQLAKLASCLPYVQLLCWYACI